MTRVLLIAVVVFLGTWLFVSVARYPRHAVLMAIPVLMWPVPLRIDGVALQQPLTAILLCGVIFGVRRELRRHWVLTALVGSFALLVVASGFLRGPTNVMEVSEARNHALTLALNAGLVLAVALASPNALSCLKAIGLSGVLISAYLHGFGEVRGGRTILDGFNANAGGHSLAIAVVTLAGLSVVTRQVRWLLVAALPVSALFATQSRGAFIVLVVGLAALWLAVERAALRLTALAAGLVVVLVAGQNFVDLVEREVFRFRDQSFIENEHRIWVLELAFNLVEKDPLFGAGYGQFLDYSQRMLGYAINTHNDWVRIAAECGVPAFVLLVVIALVPMLRIDVTEVAGRALRGGLVAICVSFLFANTMTDLRVSLPMWVFLGLAWSGWLRVSSAAERSGGEGWSWLRPQGEADWLSWTRCDEPGNSIEEGEDGHARALHRRHQ
ncbi:MULTISPECIES: O-antigen ligase family protein [unclassified Solwaraspora]|uniref:O-antigen ligase family protein n=1 Tax=unclassified Solwaraspora TaxID=2627926 RepID=UPI00259B4C5D|nr:O-antigen ligase family protein [Solwaraspora sp. WMMA2056]WJK41765.1 O-antigen ligase family protein [Solwaraspora sp. WMMA2056]